MQELMPLAERIGAKLKARKETVAVAESSAGGLISAALLAVPGASAYYLGGAVIYTRASFQGLMRITREDMAEGIRSSSEPFARLLANRTREIHGATWGISETGASGPTGNGYGDAAGHSCAGVSGPVEVVSTLETGSPDRAANMIAFARRALEQFDEALGE